LILLVVPELYLLLKETLQNHDINDFIKDRSKLLLNYLNFLKEKLKSTAKPFVLKNLNN